jgi:hypothetical protein
MTRTLLIAALLCTSVPAIAQPIQPYPPKPIPNEPACLRPRNLYDFKTVPGNRSLVVIDLARQRYRLNFMGACYNLQYHLGIGFRTLGVGSLSCVARGDSVIVRDPVTPAPCIINDIQYQTEAMDRADVAAAAAAKERH